MTEYIDREAVSEMLEDLQRKFEDMGNSDGARACVLIDIGLAQIPAADVVERKRGEWIYGEFDIPHCSECGVEVMPRYISPYCPGCGADMQGAGG